jgi:hypothetical protein
MDRRVKERLVGASILVVLIVLIVPELLSGPALPGHFPIAGSAPEPRNVIVDLGNGGQATAPASDSVAATARRARPCCGELGSRTQAMRRIHRRRRTPRRLQPPRGA